MSAPPDISARRPRAGVPWIERAYLQIRRVLGRCPGILVPYARRLLRFCALPYCYFAQIDWDECGASRLRVAYDLLYVFFRLKYYPDNYSICRLWTVDRRLWHLYYGSMYEPYQRRQLRREVQPPEYQVVFSDKEICHHVCTSLGLPVPTLLGCVSPEDDHCQVVRDALRKAHGRQLVIKPVRGAGGRNVILVREEHGEAVALVAGKRTPLASVTVRERSILQQHVQQHRAMAEVYPSSLNTIRIQTLLTRDGKVLALGAAARFGRNMSSVDNMSSGGIGVGVDITAGTLMRNGRDFDSREYLQHPETGVVFAGRAIPDWNHALELALRGQQSFSCFRLLGFDVAITPTGPVIIEINPLPDNVFVEQCYGPLLAHPDTVRAFDSYGLLISEPTRALAARLRRTADGPRAHQLPTAASPL